MKIKMRSKIVIVLGALIIILGLGVTAYAKPADNPIFPTREEVRQMISAAIAPIWQLIENLGQRLGIVEADVENLNSKVTNLESRVANIPKVLYVFDHGGQKLGLYIDDIGDYRIYMTELELSILIDPINGDSSSRQKGRVLYPQPNCQGEPYYGALDPYFKIDNIIDAGAGRYFKFDGNSRTGVMLYSQWKDGTCSEFITLGEVFEVSEITLPFSLPIATPLIIKAQ